MWAVITPDMSSPSWPLKASARAGVLLLSGLAAQHCS